MVELADLMRPGSGRGLDFVILDDLRKRTGIVPGEILKFAMSEMLCNSLDTDATEIAITIRRVEDFDEIEVKDNGSTNLRVKDLKLILDFSNKASSKRGFMRVSRGYLGNALKCITGYSYSLAELKNLTPPTTIIESHGMRYEIELKPDLVKEVIKSKITTTKNNNIDYTSFRIKFPVDRAETAMITRQSEEDFYDDPIFARQVLLKLIFATSVVNPNRKIKYDLWGAEGSLGEAGEANSTRKDTSIRWYTPKQFTSLFMDYVRAVPETKRARALMEKSRSFTIPCGIGLKKCQSGILKRF